MRYKILPAIFLVFLSVFSFVKASTGVYFRTDNIEIAKGDSFSVDLKISSDKSINAMDGTLIYDSTKLFVKEVKINDSLFSIWAKSPTFDNSKGKMNFVGGIPGGFAGKDGQVLTIIFLAKSDGDTKIDFQDIFKVFLNDGLGTNANPWMEPVKLSIALGPTEKAIKGTLQTLLNKGKENNHLLIIISIILIIIAVLVLVKIKSNKKSV